MWEANAKIIAHLYGDYVDWEERCYYCPECGELEHFGQINKIIYLPKGKRYF